MNVSANPAGLGTWMKNDSLSQRVSESLSLSFRSAAANVGRTSGGRLLHLPRTAAARGEASDEDL